MIYTSKIKAGDEVQIANGDWVKVERVTMPELDDRSEFYVDDYIEFYCHEYDCLLNERLVTDHRPAETVVPKGEGCVDWDKDVFLLYPEGNIKRILPHNAQIHDWIGDVQQGNVSNNRQNLERKRDRRRIEQELLECDGAVYEPVSDREGRYWGIDTDGDFDATKINGEAIRYYICNFMNSRTAEAALEKVGAERIRKAWGSDDDK